MWKTKGIATKTARSEGGAGSRHGKGTLDENPSGKLKPKEELIKDLEEKMAGADEQQERLSKQTEYKQTTGQV